VQQTNLITVAAVVVVVLVANAHAPERSASLGSDPQSS
jgi:hypothetical protein